jgi:4-amino-4-deoxy-L-arabinose transferase-like glycosyltransferase
VRTAWIVIAVATVAKLALAAAVPLVPDEAYYWVWSTRLAPGYFDHPPAIAFAIAVGTALLGDTTLGVRLVPILLGAAATIAMVLTARLLAPPEAAERAGTRAAWIAAVVPLAAVGLVLATPDAPLLCFAAWTCYAAARAVRDDATGWWVAAGVMIGLAMVSKYTGALLAAGLALGCAVAPRARRQFTRPGPYLAVAVASLVMVPNLRWNAAHDWVAFRFQFAHGLGADGGNALAQVGELLGGQVGLVTPVLFALAAWATWAAVRARREQPTAAVLGVAVAFLVAFFVFSATRKPVEANWPGLAYPAAFAVLAAASVRGCDPRWIRGGLGLAGAVSALLMVHAVRPLWTPSRPGRDPVNQAHGWGDLARALDSARAVQAPHRVFVATNRYQDAGEVAFRLGRRDTVYALNLASRPNQYSLWPGPAAYMTPADVLVLAVGDDTLRPPAAVDSLRRRCSVERGPLVELRRGARVVHRRILWTASGCGWTD